MKKNLRTWVTNTLVVSLLLVLACGCGKNNSNSPVLPESVTTHGSWMSEGSGRVLWGTGQIFIDTVAKTAEVVPNRDFQAHVNVVSILEPVPLKYLYIDDSTLVVDMDKRTVDVEVILAHPLPGYPEYTGFDVRGIVFGRGPNMSSSDTDPGLSWLGHGGFHLRNADGYTRWWNPSEFTGPGLLGYQDGKLGRPDSFANFQTTLNGYKYFADGLTANGDVVNPLVLSSRGRFSSSSTNRRLFNLDFGEVFDNFMVFNYAVDASWELPSNMPPMSIDDFPISANSIEPFNIKVAEEINSLYYNPELVGCPTSGGILRLNFDVATWQGSEGFQNVIVGSPDMGIAMFEATLTGTYDEFGAYVESYTAKLVPVSFESREPTILISAEVSDGSYKTGPDGLPVKFDGPGEAKLSAYQVYIPYVDESNSPPIIGAVTGPVDAVAGTSYKYLVQSYFDCQDMNEDLVFSWEIGDDVPAKYDDGIGSADGLHPNGNGTINIAFKDEGTYFVDVQVMDIQGKPGYSSAPLEVHVTLPPLPVFPPAGVNLELNLVRSILHSYEYVNNPADVPRINLKWDGSDVTGFIQEWVIYRDDNPYDGMELWQEVGTTPIGVESFSNLLTGIVGYNSGGAYYFKVTARSTAGNTGSESLGSTEWAFIEFENAEPDGTSKDLFPWSMGYGGLQSTYFRQWERPGYSGAIAGGCWMMDPDSSYMRNNIWSVIASDPIPILTDPALAATTEEWYVEFIFGGQVTPINENWDNYARLSPGTVPDNPPSHNGQAVYTQYDEAPPSDYMAGSEYYTAYYWSANNSRFDETPATYTDRYGWGLEEFGWPFNWARFRLSSLNPNGAARTRAAIGFGSGATDDARARPRVDEIAVIVY